MHIPDGFLAANTWVPAWLISIGGIGYSLKKVSELFKEKMVPLMGVMSAFIFAAQMLNFPVIGGTSGHLLGGVLAAVLLGPYGGAIAITIVLVVQSLIFQDGGLTALGANIINMSFLGAVVGYMIYAFIRKIVGGRRGIIVGAVIAAWMSVILASIGCSIELVLSDVLPMGTVLPAMVGVHALIGVGEALITYLVLSFVLDVRPDLIYKNGGEA
ncbi:MAG: energy-coupling factor ABC transporter permease [Nitrospinota bacterium]